jgi:hypothetical protein
MLLFGVLLGDQRFQVKWKRTHGKRNVVFWDVTRVTHGKFKMDFYDIHYITTPKLILLVLSPFDIISYECTFRRNIKTTALAKLLNY